MHFIGVNTWTKVVLNCISNLATKKEYYFTLETIDEQTKIALNIHI
jgi:hypothetical protein